MRIKEIDVLKGILIFLVVLGHSDFEYAREIYWFHMPAFFMVSGFLFSSKKLGSEVVPFLRKKIESLIIPYVTFLTCFSIISFFLFDIELNIKFISKLAFGGKFLVNQFGVFWFITVLLFTLVLFTFLHSKIKNKKLFFLCVSSCFIIAHIESYLIHTKNHDIYAPLNIDTALMGVVYFYFGFIFKPHYQYFKYVIMRYWYMSIFLATLIGFCVFLVVGDFNFDMKYQNYGNVIFSLIVPITITLVILSYGIVITKINFMEKMLVLMGKYSLLIMYIHLMIKYILLHYECYSLTLFVIISIIIPIVLSKLFEQNKYTSFMFLGDKSKLK